MTQIKLVFKCLVDYKPMTVRNYPLILGPTGGNAKCDVGLGLCHLTVGDSV